MAQYVRLARAIDAGKPVETPGVVSDRYATGATRAVPALTITSPASGSLADAPTITVTRHHRRRQGDRRQRRLGRHRHAERRHLQRPRHARSAAATRSRSSPKAPTAAPTCARSPSSPSAPASAGSPTPRATTTAPAPTSIRPTPPSPRAASTSPASTCSPTATTCSSWPRSPARSSTPWAATRSPTSASTSTSGGGRARPRTPCPGPTWTRPAGGTSPSSATAASTPPASTRRARPRPRSPGDMLAVPETHQIAVVVPRSALGGIDLRDRPLRHRDVRQRRGGRGHRLHPARLRRRVLEQPARGLRLDQGVPLRRRRRRLERHAEPRQRHPRPQRDRRDRRLRPDAGRRSSTGAPASPVQLPMLRLDEPAACTSTPGDVSGSVPPTLSLSLGPPAAFGAFTPGADRDYDATTTATVTSSAGDATLSVTDPSSTATGRLVNGHVRARRAAAGARLERAGPAAAPSPRCPPSPEARSRC